MDVKEKPSLHYKPKYKVNIFLFTDLDGSGC